MQKKNNLIIYTSVIVKQKAGDRSNPRSKPVENATTFKNDHLAFIDIKFNCAETTKVSVKFIPSS